MAVEIVVLIISALVSVFIGSAALLSDRRNATNRLFFALTITISLWSTLSYITSVSDVATLSLIRVTMALVVIMNTLYGLLLMHFPEQKTNKILKAEKNQLIFTAVVVAVALSPLLFTKLEGSGTSTSPVPGPGMLFFLVHVLYFVVFSVVSIVIRKRKADRLLKPQLTVLIFGAFILFFVTPFLNFVLPVMSSNSTVVRYSSALTAIFSFIIFYSIIKHKLFNVRALVAKYVAYILALVVVVMVPAYAGFYFLDSLAESTNSFIRVVLFTMLAIIIATVFEPAKRLFNGLTNALFYKEGYNAQALIDELNKTLVNNVKTEDLLAKSAALIQETLKVTECGFYVRKTSYVSSRYIGFNRKISEEEVEAIQKLTSKLDKKVHYIETDVDGELEEKLTALLNKNNIEVLVQLVSTLGHGSKGVGFLFLGPRRSGSAYSKQDLKLLEIIANELVIAIQNSLRFEEIEQFNLTLQKKVDDATKKLRNTNEKLKTLDETKDEFISMASHQLRTPLTSVKGYLSMVIEGDVGDISKSQKKLLEQAFTSSQRMVYLIADLLNVSRLRTGKFVIDLAPTNMADMVQGEVSQLLETAASRKLQLTYDKPDGISPIMLDETKTRQVVMNFIDNAIYYTPQEGKIVVSVTQTAKSIEFRVKDNGIGVPKSERHHLFTKFYRAGNARKARPDGTGLGLFMAKKVIIAQGGTIIFDTVEGKGSTFGFAFDKHKFAPPKHLK